MAIYEFMKWFMLAKEPDHLEYPRCVHVSRTIASFQPEECDPNRKVLEMKGHTCDLSSPTPSQEAKILTHGPQH